MDVRATHVLTEGLDNHDYVLVDESSQVVVGDHVSEQLLSFLLHFQVVVLQEFAVDIDQLNEF